MITYYLVSKHKGVRNKTQEVYVLIETEGSRRTINLGEREAKQLIRDQAIEIIGYKLSVDNRLIRTNDNPTTGHGERFRKKRKCAMEVNKERRERQKELKIETLDVFHTPRDVINSGLSFRNYMGTTAGDINLNRRYIIEASRENYTKMLMLGAKGLQCVNLGVNEEANFVVISTRDENHIIFDADVVYLAIENNSVFANLKCGSLTFKNIQAYGAKSLKFMFYKFSGELYGIENWDVSTVEDMRGMFLYANVKNRLNLSNWNLASAKDVSVMFEGALMTGVDIHTWNIDAIKYNRNMLKAKGGIIW